MTENARKSRNSAESFVSWSGRPHSQGEKNHAVDAASKFGGGQGMKVISNSGSSGAIPVRPQSNSERIPKLNQGVESLQGVRGKRGGHKEVYDGASPRHSQGRCSGPEVSSVRRSVSAGIQETSATGPSSSHMRRKISKGFDYRNDNAPSASLQSLSPQSRTAFDVHLPGPSEQVDRRFLQQRPILPSTEERQVLSIDRKRLLSGGAPFDIRQGQWNTERTDNMEDELHVSEEEDENYEEMIRRHGTRQAYAEKDSLSLYDDDGAADVMEESENEDEVPSEGEHTVAEEMDDALTVYGVTAEEESAKRRERRKAQAMRAKEGEIRQKQGLPRNFLLVDEYTRKPHSIGVGEWRKELMLLSRNLDPAVGNINQQPEGALAEIAEWIQHTWEYSAPVKFQFVKEVIARGVTLRRRELCKKIRNNEPRPDKVSDRTWRILGRMLQSDTAIRKSENCSKANASRVNFGRTRPSGEVGVRERLRKRLCRSPDPEEIRIEMCRDKGYGGRFKRNASTQNVMHGSQATMKRPLKATAENVARLEAGNADNSEDVYDEDGRDAIIVEDHFRREMREEVAEEGVMTLSSEEIAKHPLVMKMMERLEALEGRQSAATGVECGSGTKQLSVPHVEGEVPSTMEKERTAKERADELHRQVQGEDEEDRRTSSRLKRKVKQR